MSKTFYLTNGGAWKTKEEIVLDAIDVVCGECMKGGDERCEGLRDVCEGCAVVEIANRMHEIKCG